MGKNILIIGAGPTGLGAAHRLSELGVESYSVLERNNFVGGLAASFSREGYTMDIGGHVLFSHYPYFDKVVDRALQGNYLEHVREAWIWILARFVPYPFQNNIKFLPRELIWECIEGLIDLKLNPDSANFEEWIDANFGAGIAKYFMKPYNTKVWAHPLTLMSKEWISERVSVIDLKKV
ncbi:MAG: NAD(P)-binding protein, partial [Candidatus Margulisiibacteriota bacterium]